MKKQQEAPYADGGRRGGHREVLREKGRRRCEHHTCAAPKPVGREKLRAEAGTGEDPLSPFGERDAYRENTVSPSLMVSSTWREGRRSGSTARGF